MLSCLLAAGVRGPWPGAPPLHPAHSTTAVPRGCLVVTAAAGRSWQCRGLRTALCRGGSQNGTGSWGWSGTSTPGSPHGSCIVHQCWEAVGCCWRSPSSILLVRTPSEAMGCWMVQRSWPACWLLRLGQLLTDHNGCRL
jgi:hypothetical protein